MKALFIIHCQDPLYGASRSVGNLIRNLDADVDLLFPIKLKRDGITPEQIRTFYGSRVRHVGYLPQPARLTALADPVSLRHHVKSWVKDILYLLALPRYRQLYRKGQYDLIHLNSVTLYPMLQARWPMFLHVRETLRSRQNLWNRRLPERLKQAHGLFYISEECRAACPQTTAPGLVLVNPYDQTRVQAVDRQAALARFGLKGTETVYAIIGNIIPAKGVDFAISAFREAALENAVLLVVGIDPNREGYERRVRAEAQADARIRFLGELEDMDPVYRITDYVVRADRAPGAGRTVFESLYSGGGVILMGNREENLPSLGLPAELEANVIFYPVRDQQALSRAFQQTQHHRFEQRAYRTNIPQYVEAFQTFVFKNGLHAG